MTKKILSLALFLILAAQLAYAEGIKKGSLIIGQDFSFYGVSGVLPTGEYQKIGAFKLTASPAADIVIWDITLQLNKSSNVPNALFSNFRVEPADGTNQFYGTSNGKGVNGNEQVLIEFDDNPQFIVQAGTTKWVNIMVDVAPPGLTMQDAVGIGIYNVNSSAEELIPGIPLYGPMLSGIGGNIIIYPDFAMNNVSSPAINMKDNGKYVRFQVNFKHTNATGKKFVMKVTINGVVVRNVTIPASYKFYAFDVLKTWMQGFGDAEEEGDPLNQYYLKVELDPDNQMLELDDCNSVYLQFEMLPGNIPNWLSQSSACYF